MDSKSIYTAITIGPIYKTMSEGRRTRELWGLSYLFSYITRRIIEEIDDETNFILPYRANLLESWKDKGAGLFPDRMLYCGDISERMYEISMKIFVELSDNSGLDISYLQNYLKIYHLTFSTPLLLDESTDSNNIIFIANKLLDSLELPSKFTSDVSQIDWRLAIDKLNGKLFYKEAFNKSKSFTFPSIIEIATDDFRQRNTRKYEEIVDSVLNNEIDNTDKDDRQSYPAFQKALKDEQAFLPITLKPYHKYIAIVEADGDNIGNTIDKIGNDPEKVKEFSSALFGFALAATEKIKKYGGKAVYIGGDDLLFFAPVAVNNGENIKSIFSLIKDIDEVFEDAIIKSDKLKHLYIPGGELHSKLPSMSYGVNITFTKYPLNESRESAHSLLMKAKEIKDDKNKICFKVLKHSGQGFGFTVDKKTSAATPRTFGTFMSLVSNIPLDQELVSSVIYKLSPLASLLNSIVATNQFDRLEQFFRQEFDLDNIIEKISQGRAKKEEVDKLAFIENVYRYYWQLCQDFQNDNKPLPDVETEEATSNIAKLYSTLRFMKHLISENGE